MKNFIEERKKDIAKTIAENPTKIIINMLLLSYVLNFL